MTAATRVRPAVVAAAGLLALAAGCGGGSQGAAHTVTGAASGRTGTPQASGSASPGTASAPTATRSAAPTAVPTRSAVPTGTPSSIAGITGDHSAQPVDPADAARYASNGLLIFHSPSGNLRCVMGSRDARCDVLQHLYTAPAKPASCHFDWGMTLLLSDRARLGCVSDAVGAGRVLPYGQILTDGRIRCSSGTGGVTCTNLTTGRGFAVSREAYRLF